jgi:nitroimidazol reductase NimA-like FMN-containing flavoprotein (pyridoxamine 5'-phosphate oxidase superfamily)
VSTGYDERLEPEECRRLLASRSVARLAFVAPSGDVLVLPVAYAMDDDGVLVFRTSHIGPLSHLAEGERVSVQVDDVAEDLHNGWSVLAHGLAHHYEGDVSLRTWVAGHDEVVIGITLDRLSGRAVSASG